MRPWRGYTKQLIKLCVTNDFKKDNIIKFDMDLNHHTKNNYQMKIFVEIYLGAFNVSLNEKKTNT